MRKRSSFQRLRLRFARLRLFLAVFATAFGDREVLLSIRLLRDVLRLFLSDFSLKSLSRRGRIVVIFSSRERIERHLASSSKCRDLFFFRFLCRFPCQSATYCPYRWCGPLRKAKNSKSNRKAQKSRSRSFSDFRTDTECLESEDSF